MSACPALAAAAAVAGFLTLACVAAIVLLWLGHRRQYRVYTEHRTQLMRQVARENRASCTAWECQRRQRAAMPDVHSRGGGG